MALVYFHPVEELELTWQDMVGSMRSRMKPTPGSQMNNSRSERRSGEVTSQIPKRHICIA